MAFFVCRNTEFYSATSGKSILHFPVVLVCTKHPSKANSQNVRRLTDTGWFCAEHDGVMGLFFAGKPN